MKQSKFDYSHKPLDFIFILILLCVFSFTSLILVVLGANVYESTANRMDSNFELRTPLSYITTKVRQYDSEGAVWLTEKDGVTALVLETNDNNQLCQTWIYQYKDYLYEIYIDKGAKFNLSDGIAMIPSYGLDLSMKNQLLQISAYDSHGKSMKVSLALRSNFEKNGGE